MPSLDAIPGDAIEDHRSVESPTDRQLVAGSDFYVAVYAHNDTLSASRPVDKEVRPGRLNIFDQKRHLRVGDDLAPLRDFGLEPGAELLR